MTSRRRSSVDGGPALGLELPGLRVDGLCYHEIKQRLGLIEPTMPGETTVKQQSWVGAGVADLSGRRPDGWRQPTQLPSWSEVPDVDEYETPEDMRIVLSIGTARRLEEVE